MSANGSFTFSQGVSTGASYKVTVMTQPSSPAQNCTVTNDSGTATASGTNVQVDCGHFNGPGWAAPNFSIKMARMAFWELRQQATFLGLGLPL